MVKYVGFLILLKLVRAITNKIIVAIHHKRTTNQFVDSFMIEENLYYKIRSVFYTVLFLFAIIINIIEHDSILIIISLFLCTLYTIYYCIHTIGNKAVVNPDFIKITSFPKRSQEYPIKNITHVVRKKVDYIQNIQVYSGEKKLFEYNEASKNALLFETYIKKYQWNLE